MELVYLWVEKYKNIENQGFNFSPRFTCSYDEEKQELTIDKKDDYASIFPPNINVTAIVGENGSGKSSIFEVLTFLFYQGVIANREDKTFFLFYKNDKFFIQCENYKNIPLDEKDLEDFIKIKNNTSIAMSKKFCARTDMPLIHFSNCISDITKNYSLRNLKNYDKFYNGVQPKKPMMKSKNFYDNFNQKFQYILKEQNDFFSFLNENFIFNNFRFELHIYELGAWVAGDELYSSILPLKENGDTLFKDIPIENNKMYFYRFMALYLISKSEGVITYDDIEQKSREDKDAYSKEHIFNKVEKLFKQQTFDEKAYDKVLDICLEALELSFKNLEKEVRESFKREDFSSSEVEKLLKKYIYDGAEIWKSKIFSIKEDNIQGILETPLETELFKNQILRCNFTDEKNPEYSFLNLSSGEKLYLNVLTNYAYTLFYLENEYKGAILFDEIELSFHPNWQKRLLSHLLYISQTISKMKNKNFYLHLLFSSHSPFILSDLPKENVMFLKDGKKDNPDIEQTFGANIHTLLSHGFFMKDGLMGEFAKEKINEVITLLNRKRKLSKKNQKFCEDIISIIGEPLLQNTLQHQLNQKLNANTNETELQKLEREQKDIQAKIDKLKSTHHETN